MRWDAMGCDGVRWGGMGWGGMGCDAMGWDGMGWDGMGCDGSRCVKRKKGRNGGWLCLLVLQKLLVALFARCVIFVCVR